MRKEILKGASKDFGLTLQEVDLAIAANSWRD
jgi:hypothetical protein